MERRNLEELAIKELSMEPGLPTPRQILNQSREYDVIEKAAQLLKKVEQHWKKSLFHNKLQFSPASESLNSSESENYIEKLAAIKFKDASFKRQSFCGTGHVNDGMNNRESRMEQNAVMNYDGTSNYFEMTGMRRMNLNEARKEDHTMKCAKCLAKEGNQKMSMSVLPKQQYVLKQTAYGQRGRLRQTRGGSSIQVSPRSNDSLQTARTYGNGISPRSKSNLTTSKTRISASNPDLRNMTGTEGSRGQRYQNRHRCCEVGTPDNNIKINSLNKSDLDIVSNVSVVNIKSTNQTDPSILEVNPRKALTAPDKMIIIQHLPKVDIRPELSKQSGPVISIEAEKAETIKESKNRNIGVFNYIHRNKPKFNHQELSAYNRYRCIIENPICSEEESFAAQLELRSVAENFIFRLKKNDNPTSNILMSTLLQLMDEVNEMVELNLSGCGGIPNDTNLPPRMEMVSDLLSDELKTWGAQQPSHYQSLNNIIQHLILDIRFAKNNGRSLKVLKQNIGSSPSSSDLKCIKNTSILKNKYAEMSGESSGTQKHVLLKSDPIYDLERSDSFYRSPRSEELSLSDKLLQENALKVQRLEKAYKMNHEARELLRKKEMKDSDRTKIKEKIEEFNDKSICEESLEKENVLDFSLEDSNRLQSGSSSGNYSHPVVAIISPNQKESIEEEDNERISEVSEDVEGNSIEEDIVEDKNSIPEQDEENDNSKHTNEHPSEENAVERNISEGEDEIQEILSDSNAAIIEKHKESAGSEYDEDFEPDETEQPSHSAASSNQNEDTGKSSESHNLGTDEALLKGSLECNAAPSISRRLGADKVFIDKNTVSLPQIPSEINENIGTRKSKRLKKLDIFEKDKYGKARVGLSSDNFYSQNIGSSYQQKQIRRLDNFNDKTKFSKDGDDKENNFVKVHVRDNKGEIILSYAGSKIDSEQVNINESKIAVSEGADIASKNILKPPSSIDNYIESERKILESLTSNILKELFDNKIQSVLSNFSKETNKSSVLDQNKPSSSTTRYNEIKQQSTQTSPEKVLMSDISENKRTQLLTIDDIMDKNEIDEYQLKSPEVKLKVNGVLNRREIPTKIPLELSKIQVENDDKVKQERSNMSDVLEENRFSPEIKFLIGMVSDLDSSDVEYCESSLNQLSNRDLTSKNQVDNTNVRMHHFNSDEFLVYPQLNPQPSDVKILQYSKDETKTENETSSDSFRSRDFESVKKESPRTQRISMKNASTECDLKNFQSIQPILETLQTTQKINLSSSSTQTEKVIHFKPYSTQTPSLVDLIEISCSQSSSGSESFKEKLRPMKKDPLLTYKSNHRDNLPSQTKLNTILNPPSIKPIPELEIEELPEKSIASEQPSIANEINPLIFFNEDTREGNLLGGTTESEPNDSVSTVTDYVESSSTVDSSENRAGIHGSILRVVEASARSAAWSSSTESSTDDEKLLLMNQPLSDDDVLGDLEQLMDYLKNSKSSSSIVRIRHCSRHKKT